MRRVLLPDVDPGAVRVPTGEVVRLSGPTMGVGWRISAVPPASVLPAALAARVQARLDALVMQMSPWEAASDISRFNRAAAGAWVDLPDDFARVATRALHWANISAGAFDPTLGRLVDLWGFDYTLEMYKPAAKRRWGYFALPVLDGAELVGKVDATTDRTRGHLAVTAVHEDGRWPRARRVRVAEAIDRLADCLGVTVQR